MIASKTQFINVVINNLDPAHRELARSWQSDPTKQDIQNQFIQNIYPTSQSRYRFQQNPKDRVIRAIFEASFKNNPTELIQAAEIANGRAFSPFLKRVCWIQGPQLIGHTFRNICVKIAIVIAASLFICLAGFTTYFAIEHFTGAIVVPFVINNTPLQIVRLVNKILDTFIWILNNPIKSFICLSAMKIVILRGPHIPYLTAAFRSINFYTIIFRTTPESFLIDMCRESSGYIMDSCENIGLFLINKAKTAQQEAEVLSKQAAMKLWLTCMDTPMMTPAK